MNLLTKFNLVLTSLFAVSLLAACLVSENHLRRHARTQVLRQAQVMMQTATAMRDYTTNEIKPLLTERMEHEFFPQIVPAYAAMQGFLVLQQKFPEYTYKEAALNPTNPRNRAVGWEANVIDEFRRNKSETEFVDERSSAAGGSLVLCRPIRITDAACLSCHSTPEEAPASMIAKYGPNHGFGWKMNEVVGAQIVTVPASLPQEMAQSAFRNVLVTLVTVFVITLVVLNLMLIVIVIRPVTRLAAAADEISKGNMGIADLSASGRDEIAGLARSFNRMQRSLRKAMAMLDEEP